LDTTGADVVKTVEVAKVSKEDVARFVDARWEDGMVADQTSGEATTGMVVC
jgi:hypothetical protein